MTQAKALIREVILLDNGRFEAHIKVYEVSNRNKFPDGFKVSCALVELGTGVLRLLLDNHQPFGYHMHTKLPEDKSFRLSIYVLNHQEAIQLFFKHAEKVFKNEK